MNCRVSLRVSLMVLKGIYQTCIAPPKDCGQPATRAARQGRPALKISYQQSTSSFLDKTSTKLSGTLFYFIFGSLDCPQLCSFLACAIIRNLNPFAGWKGDSSMTVNILKILDCEQMQMNNQTTTCTRFSCSYL